MQDKNFELGDIVKLKCDDRIRLVVTEVNDDKIVCWYYNVITGDPEAETIPIHALIKVDK